MPCAGGRPGHRHVGSHRWAVPQSPGAVRRAARHRRWVCDGCGHRSSLHRAQAGHVHGSAPAPSSGRPFSLVVPSPDSKGERTIHFLKISDRTGPAIQGTDLGRELQHLQTRLRGADGWIVLAQRLAVFERFNEAHPHSSLKMRSPQEFRQQQAAQVHQEPTTNQALYCDRTEPRIHRQHQARPGGVLRSQGLHSNAAEG